MADIKKGAYEGYREKGIRLTADVSPLVHKLFEPAAAQGGEMVCKGLQMFDKAHTAMLTEEGIIPIEVGIKILKVLRQLEKKGVSKVRKELGGHTHCGEVYVTKVVGPEVGGWMHCGRSSGDLETVAWRIGARDAIITIMEELISTRKTFLEKAEEHIDTVMPGYTHLQHAEPITLGFYLLSWVHQFERDFERFQGAYKHTNISPAGCAILTTTDFPISRERTQELLGFDDIFTNAKDAIWAIDFFLETLCAVAGTAGLLGRLADDLCLWHTSEFRMVELPDAYCGTSSIMPQKKNPDGTSCVRGLDGYIIGAVMTCLAITKAQSDSCEMLEMEIPILGEVTEKCVSALQIMSGIVKDLKVNKEVMRERAGMFWAQATSLANAIVREKSVPFRTAHQVVAILVRSAYEEGIQPKDVTPEMVDRAAMEYNGQSLQLSEETLRKAMDPAVIVESKKAIGGTAPERIRVDIASSFERVKEDEEAVMTIKTKLATAEKTLEAAIDKIVGGLCQGKLG